MVRRLGYILGLLFVAACVAAYPLTWGGVSYAAYYSSKRMVSFSANCGRGYLEYATSGLPEVAPTFVTGRIVDAIHPASHWMPGIRNYSRTTVIIVPLWMPALAVSLFMAWRWRRGRTRQAAGFEVETKGT